MLQKKSLSSKILSNTIVFNFKIKNKCLLGHIYEGFLKYHVTLE